MELQPHKDMVRSGKRNQGYAIRVGQKVPKNSANLAYVQSVPVSPEQNILLEDVSSQIGENGLSAFLEKDYIVYPNYEYLLETEEGTSAFPTDTIEITDEFTVRKHRRDTPKPVFYKMELKGRFDVRNAQVLPYKGGYTMETESNSIPFEEVIPDQRQELLYIGDSIRIEGNNGFLPENYIYKIQLIRESNFLYRILVFTNFRNEKEMTFKVIYPHYNENLKLSQIREEVLNVYPFFEQVTMDQFKTTVADMERDPDHYTHLKIYTVEEQDNHFLFYATSDIMIANYQTRSPQLFRHRTEANLKTRLSETNPGVINVAFVFAQEVSGVENLSSVGKILNINPKSLPYMELKNPHPARLDMQKTDVLYWAMNLDMPEYHYEDYDILIITGYGKVDLSMYRNKFRHFLENGGTIFVDNAGKGINVLDFKNSTGTTFISDISFSSGTNQFGIKRSTKNDPYFNRIYPVTNINDLGYTDISPAIVLGQDEEDELWETLIEYSSGGNSLIRKTIFDKGTLLVSNSGIFRGVYHNQLNNLHFVFNLLLHHAEEQWVLTPWRNEFVYHKDNLFTQEYKANNTDLYIKERNDYNPNQIVAKKILHPNIKDYVKTFCKPWFYNATGTYLHNINGNRTFSINNSDFESGQVDQQSQPITEWTADTINAIPSWNTKILAGQNATFNHVSSPTISGVRQISINVTDETIGAQAFWESENIYLPVDDYEITVWINTKQVRGISTDGAKVGVYTLNGEKISSSLSLIGDKTGYQLDTSFHISSPQAIKIRLGFVDGNGFGTIFFDNISLETIGAVRGVPENTGEKSLYAFSIKPNSTTIDMEAQGFQNANITRIAPPISFAYTITPFVNERISFGVDPQTGVEKFQFKRKTGVPVSYEIQIRKSDGLMNLGYLHTLLPGIPSGREWSDTNQIFYNISLGDYDDSENNLINLKLFDRKTGAEWYYANELIIGYKDIFWATDQPSFVLHAETGFETIRASKRDFGLKLLNDNKIYCELPQTQDAKENWYLRIHNGRFTKDALSYKEWLELYQYENPDVIAKYQERKMKKENYHIKEYNSQIFTPSIGIMTVENEMKYMTPAVIKAPHKNLYIEQGSVEMEQLLKEGLADSVGTLFRADKTHWRKDSVRIYMDANNDGNIIEVFESYPYEIDFEKGTVYFPESLVYGKVYATYTYQNFRIYKRVYQNARMTNDLLQNKRTDPFTKEIIYYGKKENWSIQPVPILKTKKGKPTEETTVPLTSYKIDYQKGAIIFKTQPEYDLYADYSYFENQELAVKDCDIQNGYFLLNEKVTFKDDLFGEYAYFEDFYEYRGYYNEQFQTFFHLDLNPSVGHYSTLPTTVYVDGTPKISYKKVPSSQLLNKLIHIYIVPESENGYSIRHCFSSGEWRNLQLSNPMYLLLAKIQVREHTNVDEIVVMDARIRGGGISEKLTVKSIDQRIKGKQRYWDISNWDGKAFYQNGVLIITLPKSILVDYGGTLSEEYVRESIDKHVAYGTYYLLEWE